MVVGTRKYKNYLTDELCPCNRYSRGKGYMTTRDVLGFLREGQKVRLTIIIVMIT